jgi:hypothetical protein
MVVDRHKVDLESHALEHDGGAPNSKFTDAALAKSATHRDALGALPTVEAEQAAHDLG